MPRLLDEIAFRDPARAVAETEALLALVPPAIHSKLRFLLSSAADPDAVVHYLSRLRDEQTDAFLEFMEEDASLHYLIAVFSHSRFLSEEVLQHPEWIDELLDSDDMFRVRSRE